MNTYFKIPYELWKDSTRIKNTELQVYCAIDTLMKKGYKKGYLTRYGFARNHGYSGTQAKAVFKHITYYFYDSLPDNADKDVYRIIKKLPLNTCREIISDFLNDLSCYQDQLLGSFNEEDLKCIKEIWERIKEALSYILKNPNNANYCNHTYDIEGMVQSFLGEETC